MTHVHQPVHLETAAPAPVPRGALVVLCVAQLMLVLDLTAVNVALPTIGAELGLRAVDATAVISAYVVAFGGLMLLGGRLSDVLGRRRMLLAGLLGFTVASVVCGLATSAEALVAGRAAQGVGAALMSPAALASVTGLFRGAARVRALGAWAAVGTAGFVGGLVLSGVLTSGPGWRWIFLINVPIGLALALALPRVVPTDSPQAEPGRVDVWGGVVATGAVASLVLGLTLIGDRQDVASAPALSSLAASGVLALLLVRIESRHPAPILPTRVIRQPAVLTGLAVMLVTSAGLLTIFFLASMYAQHVLGLSALQTGLLFLPSAAATMVAAHLAGHAITRYGTRVVAVAGFLLTAVGAGVLSRISETSSVAGMVIPALVLTSIGLGPTIVVATSTTLARVEDRDAGVASGIVNTGHEVGGALGLGALAAVLGASISAEGYGSGFLGIAIVAATAAVVSALVIPSLRPEPEHLTHGH